VNGTAKLGKNIPDSLGYSLRDIDWALAHPHGHIVIETSGSTGAAKRVLLSGAAMAASGEAADRALHGPGQWLLTLPTDHIAGVNVLVRSVLAGTNPVTFDRSAPFTQSAFVRATGALTHATRYVSLVPTQLHRLLESSPIFDESLAALQSFSALLVGGAATAPHLLERAHSLGINVVTTYGMSETSGGCVYNGTPHPQVQARIGADGRIQLSGPMLADGYLAQSGGPHSVRCAQPHELAQSDAFITDPDGTRWHRTNDLGTWDAHTNTLSVLGRADDVILSGGLNISPHAIENALAGQFGLDQVCVVGIPDPEWGARVVALVTKSTAPTTPADKIKAHLIDTLGKGHAPRAYYEVDALPHTHSGKIDRAAAAQIAHTLAQSEGSPHQAAPSREK
jgi:O-succinylbenzoic acid--CoA ligase